MARKYTTKFVYDKGLEHRALKLSYYPPSEWGVMAGKLPLNADAIYNKGWKPASASSLTGGQACTHSSRVFHQVKGRPGHMRDECRLCGADLGTTGPEAIADLGDDLGDPGQDEWDSRYMRG